jgi:TrmH family RNA methyltransferase
LRLAADDIEKVFVSTEADGSADVFEAARSARVQVVETSGGVAASLSDSVTPQGIVAVMRAPAADLPSMPQDADLVVVLAEVRDPGNAGTLVRAAVAAGAGAVVFGAGSVDPLGPKTVRAAAGTLFSVRLIRNVDVREALDHLRAAGFTVVGADARATVSPEEVDLTSKVALVLGNEAWGLPDGIADLVDVTVGIPMPGPAESLNVGIAGSILLFEAVRQRRSRRRR